MIYSSIIRIARVNNYPEEVFVKYRLRQATKLFKLKPKILVGQIEAYPHNAWRYLYPNYKLPDFGD